MPKDEFDFDDPMELSGVALVTEEDTTDAMCECFIEEFLRLGYHHKQILALFRNPYYLGMNLVLQNRGEQFVRDAIAEVLARWGRPVSWAGASGSGPEATQTTSFPPARPEDQSLTSPATDEFDARASDPMGAPAPNLKL
jgi:hypothetical protein